MVDLHNRKCYQHKKHLYCHKYSVYIQSIEEYHYSDKDCQLLNIASSQHLFLSHHHTSLNRLDIQLGRLVLSYYLMDGERSQSLFREIKPVIERIGTPDQQRSFASTWIYDSLVKDRYRPSINTIALAETAVKLARESRDPQHVAFSQFSLGYCLLHAGELESAEQRLLEALKGARSIDHRVHEARCLAFLSTLYRRRGDMALTAQYARESGEAGVAVGNRHYQAHSLANFAWLAYQVVVVGTTPPEAIRTALWGLGESSASELAAVMRPD